MGKYLDPKDLTEETFEKGIEEVMENNEYWKAAESARVVMDDVPIKSKDLFLYWVNYVIRHKGGQHLIAIAPFELNIFEYLSIDVAMFLLCLVSVFLGSLLFCIRFMCRCIPKTKKKQE